MIPEEAPKLLHKCPKWLKKYAERVRHFLQTTQILPGFGLSVTETPQGRLVSVAPSAPIGVYPFKVIPTTATGGAQRVRVFGDSRLMETPDWDSNLPIDGLEEEFAIAAGELIWLEVAFTGLGTVVDSVTIEHGEPWTEFPVPYRVESGQTRLFHLIAYCEEIPSPLDGALATGLSSLLRIRQCTSTHLRFCQECIGGKTVRLCVPGFAPFIAPP